MERSFKSCLSLNPPRGCCGWSGRRCPRTPGDPSNPSPLKPDRGQRILGHVRSTFALAIVGIFVAGGQVYPESSRSPLATRGAAVAVHMSGVTKGILVPCPPNASSPGFTDDGVLAIYSDKQRSAPRVIHIPQGCPGGPAPYVGISPLLGLELFSSDFSFRAVTSAEDIGTERAYYIGVINKGGHFIRLSPHMSQGSFSGPRDIPQEWGAVFRPGSKWLYFLSFRKDSVHLMKVNPYVGISSRREARDERSKSDRQANPLQDLRNGMTAIGFSLNGVRMVTSGGSSGDVYAIPYFTPSARYVLDGACYLRAELIYSIDTTTSSDCGAGVSLSRLSSYYPYTVHGPIDWITDDSYLTVCGADHGGQLICLVTFNPSTGKVIVKKLVPDVGRANTCPIANPSHTRVAFLSKDPTKRPSPDELWTVSIRGGGLRKIAIVSWPHFQDDPGCYILDWR